MRKVFVKTLQVLLLILVMPAGNVFANEQIQTVAANVIDTTNSASQSILQRMSDSITVVAEQVLVGKKINVVEQNKSIYTSVLFDLSNRIFSGYDTEKITISNNENMQITVYVKPWSNTVKDVKINLYLSGMDKLWEDLLQEQITDLKLHAQKILQGASADAVDWAGILVKNYITKTVQNTMPYFKATVDVNMDNGVNVDIILVPVGNIVTDINYEFYSKTMPAVVLIKPKQNIANYAEKLRGLPVEFLAQHKEKIQEKLNTYILQQQIFKDFKLSANVQIVPKTKPDIIINVESVRYKIWFEGYIDLGKDSDEFSGRAHLGKKISIKDEIFTEITLYPENAKWHFDFGLARHWKNTSFSFLYRPSDDDKILRLEQNFLKNWQIRLEKYDKINRLEFALRYRIHEFLAAEIVFGKNKENYFRLVGNI